MFRHLILLAPALLFSLHLQAQTCASPFVTGQVSATEVCDPTGSYAYSITALATSDSTLQFEGLWLEQQPISADVDCNTQTFTIAQQYLLSGYDIAGQGDISGNFVQIRYGVYQMPSHTLVDSCTMLYPRVIVGLPDPVRPQLSVYPNPASDQVQVSLQATLATGTDYSYRMVDLQGRTVVEGVLNSDFEALIDLRAIARGMYRVVVQSSDGQLASKVLVVQ